MPRREPDGPFEMPIDDFLTACHFSEKHAIRIAAPLSAVDAAVRALDLGRSRIVRLLFRLWCSG